MCDSNEYAAQTMLCQSQALSALKKSRISIPVSKNRQQKRD